jgi:Putative adhesin
VSQLRVRLVAGRVDVVGRDDADGGATVEVGTVSGRPLEVRWDGGVLDVGHPHVAWDSLVDRLRGAFDGEDRAEVSIAVPRDVAVLLGTVGADGLVSSVNGRVRIRTVSGTLVLDGVTGQVSARTVSGQVDVRDHDGVFSGDSVSGSLTVQGRAIARLHAKTVSGEVGVDLRRAPEGTSRLPRSVIDVTTVSGDVTVRVPEGTGYDVTARSVSGRCVAGSAEIGGPGGPGRPGRGGMGPRKGRLSEGNGAVRLVAKTVSGDVTLVRAGHGQQAGAPA